MRSRTWLAIHPTASTSLKAGASAYRRTEELLAGHHFGMNRLQPGIVSLKPMVLARRKHPFDDIAGARQKSQKQGLNDLP